MSNNLRWLILVIIVTVFSVWVVLPDNHGIHVDTDGDGTNDLNLNVQQSLGLDLVGGLRVLLTAELPAGSYTASDLQQTANNVSRRVNALGVTEPTVQVQGAAEFWSNSPASRILRKPSTRSSRPRCSNSSISAA